MDCSDVKLQKKTYKGSKTLKTTSISFKTPPDFNFWHTVNSHGWCTLVPFSIDKEKRSIYRLLKLNNDSLAYCRIKSGSDLSINIQITSPDKILKSQISEIKRQIASCLRLEEDFCEFYREADRWPKFRWIAKIKAGRMLRAPSVFEDIIKMICTTNCSWSLTEIMVENLVGELGTSFDGSIKSFPAPETIAGTTEQFLRKKIKSGYRSPFVLKFAEDVAGGKLEIENWRSSGMPTEMLFKRLRSIKGVGEYSAAGILKLLGRYDYLGLDSWVRSKYCELYHNGRKISDTTIERNYRQYGKWRGLLFWMEMTKEWYDNESPF
ncbi:MAG: hypothetical protein JXA06_10965 [Bacteroidetes bacterium]|nr:hypothetical protein [Bacteroidota bacterium]